MNDSTHHNADTRWAMVAMSAAVVPYTVALPSFMHAKEIAIAAVAFALFIRAAVYNRPLSSANILWPLLFLVILNATIGLWIRTLMPIPAIYEAATRWLLSIIAALAFSTLQANSAREGLIRSLAAISLGLALLMPLQRAGLLPWLFPEFPTYGQPMYSVFGNQALLGGFLALGFAAWRFMPARTTAVKSIRFIAALVVALATIATGSTSAWFALGAAALIGGFAREEGKQWWSVVSGIAVAAACITLIMGSAELGAVDSGLRLWFWSGAWSLIQETPIFGSGIGSFAWRSPEALGALLHAPGGTNLEANGVHTLHAHNDYIEYIADTGFIGVFAALYFVWNVARRTSRTLWPLIAPMAAFAALTPFFAHVPFATLALFIIVAHRNPSANERPPIRAQSISGAAAIPAIAGILLLTSWIPGWHLRQAHQAHMAGDDAAPHYKHLMAMDPPQPYAARDYGSYLLSKGDYAQALEIYQRAESLGLESVDVYKGLALAAYYVGQAHDEEAKRAADVWIARWPRATEPWAIRIALGESAATIESEANDHLNESDWTAVQEAVDALKASRQSAPRTPAAP